GGDVAAPPRARGRAPAGSSGSSTPPGRDAETDRPLPTTRRPAKQTRLTERCWPDDHRSHPSHSSARAGGRMTRDGNRSRISRCIAMAIAVTACALALFGALAGGLLWARLGQVVVGVALIAEGVAVLSGQVVERSFGTTFPRGLGLVPRGGRTPP